MPGMRKTTNTYRVRQTDPAKYKRFVTKDIGGGVSLVLGVKTDGGTETQSIIFSLDKFKDEAAVKAWIKAHDEYHLAEEAAQLNEVEYINAVQLDEAASTGPKCTTWNEILREGTFINSATGSKITVTGKTLDNLIKNFYADVRGLHFKETEQPTAPWDYAHEAGKVSAGWIADLKISDKKMPDGNTVKVLLARNFMWTPEAQEAIKNGEWMYPSVDYNDWVDEKGKAFKDVLFGVALTNRPAVKWLAPVKLQEGTSGNNEKHATTTTVETTKGEKSMKKLLALLLGLGVRLSEDSTAETVELMAVDKIKTLSEINTGLETTNKKLSEDLKTAQEAGKTAQAQLDEIKLSETKRQTDALVAMQVRAYTPAEVADKKHYFNVLLAEGKFETCAAILKEKGVQLKETKKDDEDEGEADGDENALDESEEFEANSSKAKLAAVNAHMTDKKMEDTDENFEKARKVVAKQHNEKYAAFVKKAAEKKAGGKK